jgi:hypothetical protein
MVQYEIKLEHDIELMELLQIITGNELIIKVVIYDREPAVQITVKNGRQDIEQREYVFEFWSLEHADNISQIPADTIGICIEHHTFRESIMFRDDI